MFRTDLRVTLQFRAGDSQRRQLLVRDLAELVHELAQRLLATALELLLDVLRHQQCAVLHRVGGVGALGDLGGRQTLEALKLLRLLGLDGSLL